MKSLQQALVPVLIAALPLIALADHSTELPVADVPTAHVCEITEAMGIGSRGENVHCLQERLIDDGVLNLSSATGYFGPMTKAAVARWQEQREIPATGYFGVRSIAGLSRAPIARTDMAHEAATIVATTTETVHAHPKVEVSSWAQVPTVAIVLHPDSLSGYNVEIKTTNFTFAPEHVNGAVMPNEGHTHLMVNGKKVARVYGTWFHVAKENFRAGNNEVLVTLNANDHSELALNGATIQAKTDVTVD